MRSHPSLLASLLVATFLAGCCCAPSPCCDPCACRSAVHAEDDGEDDDGMEEGEEAIPLEALPAVVRKAAEAAVPGLVLTGAEREREGGRLLYEARGTADGVAYEIELTQDGRVVEIERGGEDDD